MMTAHVRPARDLPLRHVEAAFYQALADRCCVITTERKQRTTTQPQCHLCACTDNDCRQCIQRTGEPCSWVDQNRDLCSACLQDPAFQLGMQASDEDLNPYVFQLDPFEWRLWDAGRTFNADIPW